MNCRRLTTGGAVTGRLLAATVAVALMVCGSVRAAPPSDPEIAKGQAAFAAKCAECHTIGGGDKVGPDLFGVSAHHNDAWLTRWLKAPEAMVASDPMAKKMAGRYKVTMPNLNLSDAEIALYIKYLRWADKNIKPGPDAKPMKHH